MGEPLGNGNNFPSICFNNFKGSGDHIDRINLPRMQKKKQFKTPETRRILRIADILLVDGDLDEMEKPRKTMTQCSAPRRIVSRWFSVLKCRRPTKVYARGDKGDKPIIGGEGVSEGGCGVDSRSRSFNLGVACGLLCVVAAGKHELNKMVELRSQMEVFLQNAKQESGSKPVESNDINFTSFSTNFQQDSTSGSQFSLQSVAVRDDCSSDCVGNQREGDECAAGMDQLEAELRAELERLQLQLGSENNPQQQMLEDMGDIGSNRGEGDSASTDYSDEMLWGSGVAPLELERKLHLVLEARQEERIKELEDALERAEQRFQEKEIEVSWWRDTARLMSAHDSGPSYSHD